MSLRRWLWIGFFLGPGLVYFLVFHWVPVVECVFFSLQRWSLLTVRAPTRPFVGLENYRRVLSDPIFWASAKNTTLYTVFVVAGTVVLGVIVARALIEISPRFRNIAQTLIFLPVVVSMVGVAIIWKWLFDYSSGLINYLLGLLRISPIAWLTDSSWALPAVIITSIWKQLGFAVVIFLAGMLEIPITYYEAAEVDGANFWQSFRYITLPLLRPTTALVTVTQLITALQVFTQVYVMTEGGPGDATRVIVQYIYDQGFQFYAMGNATAVSLLLMAAILVVSLVQLRLIGRSADQ